MSDAPMRARRTPGRVPGFPPTAAQPTSAAAQAPSTDARLDPRGGTRQLNVRVLTPLLARYKRLVRELDDAGFETSLTELAQALLHAGPQTPDDARALVRAWRRALEGGD